MTSTAIRTKWVATGPVTTETYTVVQPVGVDDLRSGFQQVAWSQFGARLVGPVYDRHPNLQDDAKVIDGHPAK